MSSKGGRNAKGPASTRARGSGGPRPAGQGAGGQAAGGRPGGRRPPGQRPAASANPRAAKAAAAAPRRRGPSRAVIGAAVAVLLVVAAGVAIALAMASNRGSGTEAVAVPQGALAGGKGIVANPATAKAGAPTLDLFVDFQCPFCGQLEAARGAKVAELASSGEVRVVLHTKTFLDDNLRNDSSLKAGNAASCAADAGKLLPYTTALFARQPETEGDGFAAADLEAAAGEAGITGAALTTWKSCVADMKYQGYVESVETQSQKDGVFSTPTVWLDSRPLDVQQLLASETYLTQQVEAAAS